jgi:hypothetical protein
MGVVAKGLINAALDVEIKVEPPTEEFAAASTQITAPVGTLVITVWNSVAVAADPVSAPLADTSSPLSEAGYSAPGWSWQ